MFAWITLDSKSTGPIWPILFFLTLSPSPSLAVSLHEISESSLFLTLFSRLLFLLKTHCLQQQYLHHHRSKKEKCKAIIISCLPQVSWELRPPSTDPLGPKVILHWLLFSSSCLGPIILFFLLLHLFKLDSETWNLFT